jgi:HEAT repeat protein
MSIAPTDPQGSESLSPIAPSATWNRTQVLTTIMAFGAVAWWFVRMNIGGSNIAIAYTDYGCPLTFARLYGPGPVIPLRYVWSGGSSVRAFFGPALIFDLGFAAIATAAATFAVYRWSGSSGTGRSAAFCLGAVGFVIATVTNPPQPVNWLLLFVFLLIVPMLLITSVAFAAWWCATRLVSRRFAPVVCVLAAIACFASAYVAYPHDAYLNPALSDLPLLLEQRTSSDVHVRLLAIRALGRLDLTDQQIADAVIDSLGDENALVRNEAMSIVHRLGPASVKAIPALLAGLQGPHGDFMAAHALGKMGEFAKSATPALRSELKSAQGYEKLAIAEALWSIDRDAESSVPALIDLLSDEFGPIRRDAASMLGRIGAPAKTAVPKLIEMIRRVPPPDEPAPDSRPALQVGDDMPTSRLMTDREFYPQIRDAATEALMKIDPQSARSTP